MNSKRMVAWATTLVPLLLASCTTRLIDFTIISSKNVDLTNASSFKRASARTEGNDHALLILFIPIGIPNVKDAVDRAIAQVPGGVALVDGVVRRTFWWVILFGMDTITVEGTPLIDPKLANGELPESNFMASYTDPSTKETRLVYLSEAEYRELRLAVDHGNDRDAERILAAH